MTYKNFDLVTLFSMRKCKMPPRANSPKCCNNEIKSEGFGIKVNFPSARKKEAKPKNPDTVAPKEYAIFKRAGMVIIKRTTGWNILYQPESSFLYDLYECTGFDLLVPLYGLLIPLLDRLRVLLDFAFFRLLFATGVHYKDIESESYKFFPVKEPLEFTLGFTERKNEMEVL